MIWIQVISPPLKLSGLSSVIVSFDWAQNKVDAMHTVPGAIYHKKDKIWEVPITSLATLLDTMTLLDDIKFRVNDELETSVISEPPLTEEEIAALGFDPYKHQVEGINYGLDKKKWLLLDNPGCGKTNQIIGLAETLHRRGLVDHCLVIAGINSLKSNWAKEIKKFGTEQSIIIGEKKKKDGTVSKTPMSLKERVAQLNSQISEFFVIINVESLRDDAVIKAISSGPNKFQMIAIDEVHKCVSGDTVVETDRGSYTVADLYSAEALPKILTYNTKNKLNELKSILDITKSTPTEDVIELTIQKEDGVILTLQCTESHKIFTSNRGWVKAKDLTFADDIKILC